MGAVKAESKLNLQCDALFCGQNFLPQGKEYAMHEEEEIPVTFTASISWKEFESRSSQTVTPLFCTARARTWTKKLIYLWARNCKILHSAELVHFHLEHLGLISPAKATDWMQHSDSHANSHHLLTPSLLSGKRKEGQTGKAEWPHAASNFSCLALDTT